MLLDLWEPLVGRQQPDVPVLTSVEITVTGLCNLRCIHCAVGEQLVTREPERIPPEEIIRVLDRVPTLTTLSLTGGEPSIRRDLIEDWAVPILRYAKDRGLQTQFNTNLTFELERYLPLEGLVDVLHITWNYRDPGDFARIARVPMAAAERYYHRILRNAEALAARGWFVSAESMMTHETLPALGQFNRLLAAVGCRRHEIHPRYQADWGASLPVLDLETMAEGIERFLEERDPNLWVLFGTFPFFPCSPDPRHRALWRRVREAPGVTIRNDPDGRNRLNIDGITGAVRVTDFADIPPLGNIREGADLVACFAAWQEHPAYRPLKCCCPEAACLGPNLLVAQMYYPGVDFTTRRAILDDPAPAQR
ncbi:MAG: radical SAM/CxCxxxxC motif protein YfkAB [Firmicutes bacterium]|nr:radical SAM/CxCxxxxC motif protein YfkAB [Bacillota bacterium]